jgi:hypothetical protein
VDERDGSSGLSAVTKQLFFIDVSGATDLKDDVSLPANFTAVAKGAQPFLDLLDPAYGLKTADFPQKIEGVAFGDDIVLNGVTEHTLWITNDNDFDPGTPNNFYVFGIDPADLPNYQAQAFAPEPQSLALLAAGLGLLALAVRRKS